MATAPLAGDMTQKIKIHVQRSHKWQCGGARCNGQRQILSIHGASLPAALSMCALKQKQRQFLHHELVTHLCLSDFGVTLTVHLTRDHHTIEDYETRGQPMQLDACIERPAGFGDDSVPKRRVRHVRACGLSSRSHSRFPGRSGFPGFGS
jgi:hypothetical protein